jgi:hypothetical protein
MLMLSESILSSISEKTSGLDSLKLEEWLLLERSCMVVSPFTFPLIKSANNVDPQVLASYQKTSMPGLLDYAGYYTLR